MQIGMVRDGKIDAMQCEEYCSSVLEQAKR